MLAAASLSGGCGEVWNNPYPALDGGKNVLYSSFAERPKHLDPVQSYTEDESKFTQQVYEPPLQYHYLKIPYELIPLTAEALPVAKVLEGGKFTQYEIRIRPGVRSRLLIFGRYAIHSSVEPRSKSHSTIIPCSILQIAATKNTLPTRPPTEQQ